jgi:hypothetical protein
MAVIGPAYFSSLQVSDVCGLQASGLQASHVAPKLRSKLICAFGGKLDGYGYGARSTLKLHCPLPGYREVIACAAAG